MGERIVKFLGKMNEYLEPFVRFAMIGIILISIYNEHKGNHEAAMYGLLFVIAMACLDISDQLKKGE